MAGEEGEEGIRLTIGASGQLYLFGELVGAVIQFLLYRYNMEDIELIFRKLSEYRSAMRRARDARRVYTEANILEELDS